MATRPVTTPNFELTLLPFFFLTPQLFSLAQFPRAGINGAFDTRYMLGTRLTYRPRLGPRRAELLCFQKNVFLLNLIFVFVYSFRFVYSFNFCIFCIVTMQESSRQGSLLPPSRWSHSTSLHPPHALGHTSPGVGRGWEGFREVILPVYLPPPHRGFPFPAFFSLVYSYI